MDIFELAQDLMDMAREAGEAPEVSFLAGALEGIGGDPKLHPVQREAVRRASVYLSDYARALVAKESRGA